MARILTGIQCTGRPHLGNVLGAMLPAMASAQDPSNEALFFVADLHTLTTIKDPDKRKEYVYATAAAWLALGLDTDRTVLYRQSKAPAVCELTWYLSCFTPYPMLTNAHAFKDKANRRSAVSAGLFTYPVLMAADILLYKAEVVPVGTDQLQHLEMARDIANSFNYQYGDTFVLPQAQTSRAIQPIPGTDGQKMSKSYHNTIDIFLPEKQLRKTIMAIQTDSTALAAPKNPAQCTVFSLYSILADEAQIATMRTKYLEGGYGYGEAKQALLGLILEKFAIARQRFDAYMHDLQAIDRRLAAGEAKANAIATQTLEEVRAKLGY
ncbi:MAG: tryptophan--tRNA ligase [Bacteroidota bacterium]